MRTRFLFTSAATVALLSVLPAQAFAQKGDFLESRAPWSVTKIAANGPANAYCAMAKKFNQDVILTIARNVNSESSFAIDFQSPKFSTEKIAAVTLDAGAGQQRNYKLQPVSSQAFVVRLGNDAPFFEALKKTGFLRFEIDQKSYSFNLADVDTGDTRLDACVAASVLPAAGDETAAASGTASPADREKLLGDSYRQEINSLRASIKALEDKNNAMSQQMAGGAQSTMIPLPADDGLSKRAAALETQNQTLRTQLEQAKASIAPAADPKILSDLQSENARLKNQMAALSNANIAKPEQMAALGSEIDRLTAENARLKAESSVKPVAVTTPAPVVNTAALDALRQENARLKQQQAADEAGQTATVADLQARLKDLEAKNIQFSANGAAQASGETAALSKKIAALESENQTLRAQLQTAQADNEKLQSSLVSANNIQGDTATLRAENEKLTLALNQMKAGTAQAAVPQAEIAQLQKEALSFKEQIKTIENQKAAALKNVQTLDNENRALKEELSQAQAVPQEEPLLQTGIADMKRESRNSAALRTPAEDKAPVALETTQIPQADSENSAMTEAQREEKNLLQSLDSASPSEEKPITVRASEDPFADIDSGDNFSGFKSVEGGEVKDITDMQPPAVKVSDVTKEKMPATPAPDMVQAQALQIEEIEAAAPMPLPPVVAPSYMPAMAGQGLAQASSSGPADLTPSEIRARKRNNMPAPQAQIAAIPDAPHQFELPLEAADAAAVPSIAAPAAMEPSLEIASMQHLPTAPPAPSLPSTQLPVSTPATSAMPEAPTSPSKNNIYSSDVSIESILSHAGVINGEKVELVSDASNSRKAAYQWKTSDVYGSAVQEPMANADEFDSQVKDYLQTTQERCTGDFAVTADDTRDVNGKRIDSYEIACIAQGVNSSASLVFFNIGGTFTAVAHETPTAELATAMEIRDRLVREVSGS